MYKFKVRWKAMKTTRDINQAFSPAKIEECTLTFVQKLRGKNENFDETSVAKFRGKKMYFLKLIHTPESMINLKTSSNFLKIYIYQLSRKKITFEEVLKLSPTTLKRLKAWLLGTEPKSTQSLFRSTLCISCAQQKWPHFSIAKGHMKRNDLYWRWAAEGLNLADVTQPFPKTKLDEKKVMLAIWRSNFGAIH